uniref:helix-turn-helix domain-containing protein n=3 Tax=Desulfogranum japonicum TaxID=231447 RepID=UPI00048CA299
MLGVSLSKEQENELHSFRKQASSKDSEKALIILLSNDGKTVPEIAQILKRNPHTIRDWLKRYMAKGIKGLNRNFSPGRPPTVRTKIKNHI